MGTLVIALMFFDQVSSTALLQSRMTTLADVVGQISTAALNFEDTKAAIEVLEALRSEPPVVSACLYDVSDRLFAEYKSGSAGPRCAQLRHDLVPTGSNYSRVVRQVYRRSELVGTLALTSDLQDVRKRRTHLLVVAGFLAVVALVVGGISGSLLQRRVSKPLLDLARAMVEVTDQQNFAARVAVKGSDEIGQLGDGFNTMLSELERRNLEKRKAEAELQFQALTDALTRLPNRRLFMDRLSQTLALAEREGRIVGLLYIDLDGFKLVNDSLGHAIGDLLLCEVSSRLQARVRKSDTLARMGGDEFTIILPSLSEKEDAALVARSLLDALVKPFLIEGHEITIGATIGISLFPEHAREASDLMRQADSAMYAAKRNGKNQAMYFRPELGLLVRERLNLETQLRGAIGRGEIKVHYQPEFDVASGRLVRFEALVRWLHPSLGLIPPLKFIPIAEESGLIVPLGAFIMECACKEATKWQSLAPFPIQVAVNVSSIQFERETFVEEVAEILRHSGLKPELLQIELTESVMVGSIERSAQKMMHLRSLGVSLAIDDFGTGYSCLGYLPNLPFDALKIDRSFVKDLNSKPEAAAMVRALVGLAHNIGMRVIVEGIEDSQQLQLIRQFAANEVQGFLLGRPTTEPEEQILLSLEQSTRHEKLQPSLEDSQRVHDILKA